MKKIIVLLSITISLSGMKAASGSTSDMQITSPQVYIEISQGQYQFFGGLLTGAVGQDLQRTDIIPLPHLSSSDTIGIRIKGVQNETQYIDFVELRQVAHPPGTEVVGNHKGDLFIIRHLKMPNDIRAGEMIDRSNSLLFRDGQNYSFHIADSSNQSHIEMKFSRKEGDKKAVLVARIKNSTWGGYITNELRRNTTVVNANYYPAIANSSLTISLMTKYGWKIVDFFPPAGNTATRDLAMEIDLSEVDGKDVIVKMEAPYRFWDLDHVGLCYEILKPSYVSALCRVSARVEGKDFSGSVDRKDGLYLALEARDQVELEYIKRPEIETGTIATYVLVANGYYNLKSQTHLTQTSPTLQFSNFTSLNKYSIAKYKELGYEH